MTIFQKLFRKAYFIRMKFDCWTNINFHAKWRDIICQAKLFKLFFHIFLDASYVFDDYKIICQENESHKIPLPSCICFSFSFVSWSCRRCLLTCFAFSALLDQCDRRSDSAKQTEFVWTSEALIVWRCNWELWKEASKEPLSCYLHTSQCVYIHISLYDSHEI